MFDAFQWLWVDRPDSSTWTTRGGCSGSPKPSCRCRCSATLPSGPVKGFAGIWATGVVETTGVLRHGPGPTGHLVKGISLFNLGMNSHCNSLFRNVTQLLTQESAFSTAVWQHGMETTPFNQRAVYLCITAYRWLDNLLRFLCLPYFSAARVLSLYLHYFIARGIRRFKASVTCLFMPCKELLSEHLHSYNDPEMYPGTHAFPPPMNIYIFFEKKSY